MALRAEAGVAFVHAGLALALALALVLVMVYPVWRANRKSGTLNVLNEHARHRPPVGTALRYPLRWLLRRQDAPA